MPNELNNQQKNSLIPFFLFTFFITWGIGALAIFLPAQFQALVGELTDTSPVYFLAIAAPTISATILTFARDGWNGLKSLYERLFRWRFGVQWYALVLIGVPLAGWIATRFTESNPLKETGNLSQLIRLLFYLLITGPLCGELGWRGYALPRLLNRFTPFAASLILGVIWGGVASALFLREWNGAGRLVDTAFPAQRHPLIHLCDLGISTYWRECADNGTDPLHSEYLRIHHWSCGPCACCFVSDSGPTYSGF